MPEDPKHSEDLPPDILGAIKRAIRIGITFTSRNIFDEQCDLSNVREILAAFNQSKAIALCAEWNRWNTWVMFHEGTWKQAVADQQRVLDELVPPNFQRRAAEVFDDERFVSPFSEISILGLIGLLCRYAQTTGGESANTRHGQRALFRALLALQEGVFPENFLDLPVEDQFPYSTRVTLANLSLQNRWAYDMGRLHILLTVPEISRKLAGISVAEWFQRRLGIDGKDYECVANTLLGSAFYRADYSKLPIQAPGLYQRMTPLLLLSTTSPAEVAWGLDRTSAQAKPTHLSDAVPHSNVLLVRPILQMENNLICTSTRNLFNKLHRGLPYLCLEARRNPAETKAAPRNEFGDIFECYAIWLMRQWMAGPEIRFVTNYWVRQPKGKAERDILVIHRDVGYLFEVKATVPAMNIRRFGNLQDLVDLHTKAAQQAYTAAEALLSGSAFEDAQLSQPLPKLNRIVPCAITYEFLAVRWPHSDAFERALQKAVGKPLFSSETGILPFQILDVQQVEVWDDLFSLPSQVDQLLQALEVRSLDPLKRYRDFPEDERYHFRPDYVEKPGIVRTMVEAAEESSRRRLHEIQQPGETPFSDPP